MSELKPGESKALNDLCSQWASARLSTAAADSYRKHFYDPLDAAERDLLGEALKLLLAHVYPWRTTKEVGADFFMRAERLLAKVKP